MIFELAPHSLALFEDGEIRKTKKSAFYDLIAEITVNVNDVQKFSYVIDGMLIHRCKWQLNENFGTFCEHYVRYLHKNYGCNIYVVF